jgi:putative heme-binding domain-containing protein
LGIKKGVIVPANLSPATIQALLSHKDQSLYAAAQEIFGSQSETERLALIEDYQLVVEIGGDQSRGEKVCREHCANCHLHNGIGQNVGPALSALASKDRAYILKSILQPNAAVEWKYKSYNLMTEDGRLVSGMISGESATSVEIVTSDGKKTSLLLSEIEDMRNSTKSFMPEGFERSITPDQMADLMEFVRPMR